MPDTKVTPGLRTLAVALSVLGLVQRVAPLFDHDGRLARQFPTEDAYLMLTVARNLAIGKGMSIADGTIPTNGVQPLATLLYALGFASAGGDRSLGVLIAQLACLAISVGGALGVYVLGRRVLHDRDPGGRIALLAAATWFAAPLVTEHSMNCLETGLYAVLLTWFSCFFIVKMRSDHGWRVAETIGLGAFLGVLFWARNDACLFILAVCSARMLLGPRAALARRTGEAVALGLTAIVVSSPWLIYNKTRFGHIVPISGIAESFTARFASNLPHVAPNLFEFVFLPIRIPESLEASPVVQLLTLAATLVVGAMVVKLTFKSRGDLRVFLFTFGVFALGLCAFYGLWFGAPWFLSRYLFPISPFLALLWSWAAIALVDRYVPHMAVRVAVGVVLCLAVSGLAVRTYAKGTNQGHFQVVDWVDRHVPAETWVAATQTGTLGFYHDRTINLDGKVNPDALRERQEKGDVIDYVIGSPAAYIADWYGHARWVPRLKGHFSCILDDPALNLTVLERVK